MMCVCVRACVRACVRVHVRDVCVRECVRVRACVRVCVGGMETYPRGSKSRSLRM